MSDYHNFLCNDAAWMMADDASRMRQARNIGLIPRSPWPTAGLQVGDVLLSSGLRCAARYWVVSSFSSKSEPVFSAATWRDVLGYKIVGWFHRFEAFTFNTGSNCDVL